MDQMLRTKGRSTQRLSFLSLIPTPSTFRGWHGPQLLQGTCSGGAGRLDLRAEGRGAALWGEGPQGHTGQTEGVAALASAHSPTPQASCVDPHSAYIPGLLRNPSSSAPIGEARLCTQRQTHTWVTAPVRSESKTPQLNHLTDSSAEGQLNKFWHLFWCGRVTARQAAFKEDQAHLCGLTQNDLRGRLN